MGQLSLLLIAKYWINNVAIRSHWLRTPKKRFPNLKISKMDANWGQKIWPKKKRVEKINWSNNRAVNRETKILTHSSTGRSVPFHKFGELWKVEKDENKQKRGRIGSFKKEIKWITRRMFVKRESRLLPFGQNQCDQIEQFMSLWETFLSLWQHLFCPNCHIFRQFFKICRFLVKSFLGHFFKHFATLDTVDWVSISTN